MKALVLWADARSANLGVRALAEGTAAVITTVWPDAELVFHNYGSRTAPVRVGSIRAALKERVTGSRHLAPWLGQFHLVVDTRAGDSFADIYGLERLAVMTLLGDAVRRARVPLVLGPQTIGPFGSRRATMLARRSLRASTSVMARDTGSAAVSAALGRPVDALTTDVVFALPRPTVGKTRDVVLNVSGLLWQASDHVDSAQYRQTIRSLADRLRHDGRSITLMPHVIDSPAADNDVVVLPAVQAAIGGDAEVAIPQTLADARRIVASAHLTIGSRMHACLNSLSVGTPAIPLSYSSKFAPLLADLGWTATVDLREDLDAAATAARLAGSGLEQRVAPARDRADELLSTAIRAFETLRDR